ncbi:hypothetical protein KCP75_18400 [Salmonella enterica subsp. enterica]|nr:hypothetical protein KCP75_18400 [Salmonella enterica subsp. enterica]
MTPFKSGFVRFGAGIHKQHALGNVASISLRPRRNAGSLVKTLLVCQGFPSGFQRASTSAGWQWPSVATATRRRNQYTLLPCWRSHTSAAFTFDRNKTAGA